jgi:two-component system phosphate regulon sensor histidine kinase PhoR
MAHEFRTLLTNINLAANLLSKNVTQPGDAKFLDIIQKENARLIQQVERVLHLARLENGDYALKTEPLNLRALLNSVCEEMQMQIEEKKQWYPWKTFQRIEIRRQAASNAFASS